MLNAFAQDSPDTEQRPEPGSVVVPVQEENDPEVEQPAPDSTEEEQALRTGSVRIWNFVEDAEPKLASGVRFMAGSGAAKAAMGANGGFLWLNRGMRSRDIKGYVQLPEGTYELVIVPETVQKFTGADEEFLPPAADASILSPKLQIDVAGNGFSTVILQGPVSAIQSGQIKDNLRGAINPTLRVFNFTDVENLSIARVEEGVESPILSKISAQASLNIANLEGETTYVLKYPGPNQSSIRRFKDVTHSKGLSFSMLIFEDRYDRLTFSALPDGIRQ